MNEYEKSKMGLPYLFDSLMFKKYKNAVSLTTTYNNLDIDDTDHQEEILSQLLGHKGNEVNIMAPFRCEFGHNISLGNNVFINFNCIILDNGPVTIGNDVAIGPNVSIYTVNHAIDPLERAKGLCTNKPVTIGNNVWIAGDVKILPGVTIGEESIIGAGSVVTKSIPSKVIAAGNPCRVIKSINE